MSREPHNYLQGVREENSNSSNHGVYHRVCFWVYQGEGCVEAPMREACSPHLEPPHSCPDLRLPNTAHWFGWASSNWQSELRTTTWKGLQSSRTFMDTSGVPHGPCSAPDCLWYCWGPNYWGNTLPIRGNGTVYPLSDGAQPSLATTTRYSLMRNFCQ